MSNRRRVLATALLLLLVVRPSQSGTPSRAIFYHDQLVDHSSSDDKSNNTATWTQRFYASATNFAGPGHPIFLVMGGEGAISPSTGLYYPFITDTLSKRFGAYVLQPEHRFYGVSQPLGNATLTRDDIVRLVTSEQAMADAARLLRHIQVKELGCSVDRASPGYCPTITVGGSYPGFLSAMMRVVHPDVVDAAYAASAPMKFYDQTVGQDEYYDHITVVAESCSAGCSDAVRRSLAGVSVAVQKAVGNFWDIAASMGICKRTIPRYIQSGRKFREELMMIIGYTFANYNMAYYPPGDKTALYKSCQIFQGDDGDPLVKVRKFLRLLVGDGEAGWEEELAKQQCFFNMSSQLPAGSNATITSGDWSGVGTGRNGEIWDVQTCTLLVERIGFSSRSMFPNRPWTLEWLRSHCASRFGVEPHPYAISRKWKFNDLVNGANTSRILFTNGMNDGWSVGGIKTNLSDTILALNIESGAHHSDLSGRGPSPDDTAEVKEVFKTIASILGQWIDEIRNEDLTSAQGQKFEKQGPRLPMSGVENF